MQDRRAEDDCERACRNLVSQARPFGCGEWRVLAYGGQPTALRALKLPFRTRQHCGGSGAPVRAIQDCPDLRTKKAIVFYLIMPKRLLLTITASQPTAKFRHIHAQLL